MSLPFPAAHPPPPAPAGLRRLRIKVALNVAVNDLVSVLVNDAELPWLEAAISRATAAPPPAEALIE